MLRNSLMLTAVALVAVHATGCTHCDTCDDFPIPCVGPNCGALTPASGSYTSQPIYPPGAAVQPLASPTQTGPLANDVVEPPSSTAVPGSMGPANNPNAPEPVAPNAAEPRPSDAPPISPPAPDAPPMPAVPNPTAGPGNP